MIQDCRFNKSKDFEKTVPDLAMSISMALQTGVVSSTSDSAPYNDIDDTSKVGNYLHDAIDIAMASKRLGYAMQSSAPTSTDINEVTK